jgi:SAM-dependent methyltransferase
MSSAANFNRLAAIYRWLEYATFGPFLSRTRRAFLPQLTTSRHALVLGDGDGRFTAHLLRTNPAVQIHAIDASPAMLSALIRRAGPHAPRLSTQQADLRQWRPHSPPGAPGPDFRTWDSNYDAIFTHFFLDCLTTHEVQSLAATVRRAASPSAVWVVSDFAIPPNAYGRLIARPLVGCLYFAFALLTGLTVRALPDHHSALGAAGFTLQTRRTFLGGLLISELWSSVPSQIH